MITWLWLTISHSFRVQNVNEYCRQKSKQYTSLLSLSPFSVKFPLHVATTNHLATRSGKQGFYYHPSLPRVSFPSNSSPVEEDITFDCRQKTLLFSSSSAVGTCGEERAFVERAKKEKRRASMVFALRGFQFAGDRRSERVIDEGERERKKSTSVRVLQAFVRR